MAVNRSTVLIASALVLAIVVAVWTSGGSSAPTPAQPVRPPAPRNQPGQEAEGTPIAVVNLEALTSPRQQPVDVERNPFRFKPRAAAPAPSVSTGGGGPAISKPAEQAPVIAAAPPVPAGPPPPPPIPLKFIGIMTQGNKRVAVLTDGKSAPQGGEEGAIILGQYRILKIGNESIEMAYVDGRGRTTIRLTGQ
jgi:hypothetical protein